MPDFASRFQFSAAAAVHVCRLGKNIAQRFANRYYEEAGLCLVFEAKDLLDTLNANGKPRALATSFDASHIVGEMTPTDIAMLGKNTATLEINGKIQKNSRCRQLPTSTNASQRQAGISR